MASRELTQVYLDPGQKQALQKMAKQHGTKASEEIRRAVKVYVSGLTPEDIETLDVVSRAAERDLQVMSDALDATNRKLDQILGQLEQSHQLDSQAA